MNKLEVLKDLEVTDQSDPLFGSHAPGSILEAVTTDSVLQFIEQGFLKIVEEVGESMKGESEPSSSETNVASPEKPAAPGVTPNSGPVLHPTSPSAPQAPETPVQVPHPDHVAIASKFPEPPEAFKEVPTMLYAFCMGIQHHEVYSAPGEDARWPNGTRSYHDHNPGNLRFAGQLGSVAEDKDGFCVFPDYNTGFTALTEQVLISIRGNRKYPPEVFDPVRKLWRQFNIYDFFKVYDSSFGDNPKAYAEDVCAEMSKIAGVTISADTPLRVLVAA